MKICTYKNIKELYLKSKNLKYETGMPKNHFCASIKSNF